MVMSKNKIAAIVLLGIVLIPFFVYKQFRLNEYNKYPGIIKGFTETDVYYPGFRGSGGYETRTMPEVEYYTQKDTFTFDAGKMSYFAKYDVGDAVTVLERKDNPDKAELYSFSGYYMQVYEFLTLILILGVVGGTYFFIVNNGEIKNHKKS